MTNNFRLTKATIASFIIMLSMFSSVSLFSQNEVETLLKSDKVGRTDISLTLTDGEQETYLPISIINGSQPGPVFALVAGVHGFEYPPIMALQAFLNEIDASQLRGSLIVVPIANVASFYARTPFISPIDHKNLNNVFPGNPNGSMSDRLAYLITNEVIANSDVFLDIHAGDANEDLLPFICYYNNPNNAHQSQLADELCRVSGFENIVSYDYNLSASDPALYAFKQATQDGKTALSIESGKLGNVQPEAVEQTKDAIYNMLHKLDMYALDVLAQTDGNQNFYDKQAYVKSVGEGILYSNYVAGDKVEKNDLLGYVTDVFGNKLQNIYAPASGIVLYKTATPPINANETLFCIGYNTSN